MNQRETIYFSPGFNNTTENNSGKVILQKNNNLSKQDTYKERHINDFQQKSLMSRILDTFKPALILCIIITIIFKVFIMNGFIPSESMDPTLKVGDGIVVNRLAYVSNEPAIGDIVVFNSAEYSGQYLIKRVIGLPGDIIDIKDGEVYVNNCKLIEGYAVGVTDAAISKISHFEVPADSVFLLGDNREASADSRWWENPYISYDDIIGKAIFQYSLNFKKNGIYSNIIKNQVPSFINE